MATDKTYANETTLMETTILHDIHVLAEMHLSQGGPWILTENQWI